MTVRITADSEVPYSATAGERLFVFGDQHGEVALLCELMNAVDIASDVDVLTRLVFLGDLIDRGPDSLGCLDLAIGALEKFGADRVIGIAGNHEEMLYSALYGPTQGVRTAAAECWARNGGNAVLKELGMPSSGDALLRALNPARVAWLRALRSSYRSGDFIFVHAGLNSMMDVDQLDQPVGVDLTDRFDEALSTRWIRDPFHGHEPGNAGWFGCFVAHGHDPIDGRRPYATNAARSRLNLDGGSNRTGRSRMAVIEGRRIVVYEANQ